jgi:Helix-turn-helix domain
MEPPTHDKITIGPRVRQRNRDANSGLIDYNGSIEVRSSLLNVVLHDEPQSPHQYVSAKRLERAKVLTRGDQTLVDIALACQANFARAFRRATGQTPGQFRRSSG